MKHPIHSVVEVAVVAAYTLRVRFEDGTMQTVNLEPMLRGELYGPLRDPALFNQVRVDPEVRTLVWPNGADFDPETLYDWPNQSKILFAKAEKWRDLAQTGS